MAIRAIFSSKPVALFYSSRQEVGISGHRPQAIEIPGLSGLSWPPLRHEVRDGVTIVQAPDQHLHLLFFGARDRDRFRQIDERTTRLQQQMWAAVRTPAVQPNQFTALAVSGMNDVLSSQSNTQAAWWNRIPAEAWALMGLIAIMSNLMLGVSARHLEGRSVFFVLPLVMAIAFFLIADIDSAAGGGVIHVAPQNLVDVGKLMR